MSSYNQLREFLADIEHQQWIYWSKDIASKEKLSDKVVQDMVKSIITKWNEKLVQKDDLITEFTQECLDSAKTIIKIKEKIWFRFN